MFLSIPRFFREFKKYYYYMIEYTKALNTVSVSNTSLGVLWWFLDPLLNMGIYIILVRVIFSQKDPNFPVFFFSAMLVWRYFSMMVQQAATSISANISICKDTYIPKFIFSLSLCISGLTPLLFSLSILGGLMILFQTPITIHLLWIPFLLIALVLFTFACSIIVAHINVFMNDFQNILPHIITLGMFATPIFYSIDKVPGHLHFWYKLNPIAILTIGFRNVFTYGIAPPLKSTLMLFGVTLLLLWFAVALLYKYDKVYNKVSR